MKRNDLSATIDPTRRFLRRIAIVLVVFAVLAFGGTYWRTQSLIDGEALNNARSYADLIASVRSWNALQGGVWGFKGPGIETNRYLLQTGVSADAAKDAGRDPVTVIEREIPWLHREG